MVSTPPIAGTSPASYTSFRCSCCSVRVLSAAAQQSFGLPKHSAFCKICFDGLVFCCVVKRNYCCRYMTQNTVVENRSPQPSCYTTIYSNNNPHFLRWSTGAFGRAFFGGCSKCASYQVDTQSICVTLEGDCEV
jgi:hypothetical protein